MFDDNFEISETGTCTGDFCPISPEVLASLLSDEVANANLGEDRLNPAVNLTEQNETSQTIRYLEDRVIAMGQQIDRLLESTPSTERSAIAQTYTLLERGKGVSELKLLEPETQPARAYFQRQAQKPYPSIVDCFLDCQKALLIVIDSESHEILLSFAFRPCGKDFEPIKMLRVYPCSWLLRQFCSSEFRFGFAKVLDLKAIAWAVALAYKDLGYQCQIEYGSEVIDVDGLIAEVEPSALWMQLEEVRLCA